MTPITSPLGDAFLGRVETLKTFFGLPAGADLISAALQRLELTEETAAHLAAFNVEWHVVPPLSLVPFDAAYLARLYPWRSRDVDQGGYETPSVRQALEHAHGRVAGTIVGVETTMKPDYLPGNAQFYGTRYGLDPTFDPFAPYIQKAGLKSGPRFMNSRFAHTLATLRSLGEIVNADWKARNLVPAGYHLTVCPPTVFNLVGTLFHPEWSQTTVVELSGYRDDRGNARGLAVGSNGPGDFSYVRRHDIDADLELLGFRVALVPLP